VKRVKLWTTIACDIYDSIYCKVKTIVVYDIQIEGTEGQIIFWHYLNKVMVQNGVLDPTFKEFMFDSSQANFNAVHIVYGSKNPFVPMVARKRSCLFHWATSMHKYIENLESLKNFKTNISDSVGNTRMQHQCPR